MNPPSPKSPILIDYSVRVNFDGDHPVLSFPGFHQVFFYGDYKQQLVEFCRLFNFEAQVV